MAILDQILGFLQTAAGSAVLVIVADFVLRLVPTARKLGIIAPVLRKIGQGLVLVADLLDKLLPQNVVVPVEAPKV